MRSFTDPVRNEEWRVLVEMDSRGHPHAVFVREAVRLHPSGDFAAVDDLSDGDLRQLFLTSSREIRYENQTWLVRWEEKPDLKTWTWFESASGSKKCMKVRWPFPYDTEAELAVALRMAAAVEGGK